MMRRMYQVKKAARSEFVPIRNLNYHVLTWGQPGPGKIPMVMVHGWMDVAASYQFMVDAFAHDHYVIAPDWRGYGLTTVAGSALHAGQVPASADPQSWQGTDSYWFADYLGDLDALIDHYSPDAPVHLVGHSMGGNVAMLYAGCRPQRIRRLVNLEGFGMPDQPAGPGAPALRPLDGRAQGLPSRRDGAQDLRLRLRRWRRG